MENDIEWSLEKDAVEIRLPTPDDFLKVKETLTRMGVPAFKDKKLFQSCHILHKRGRYFILHFKELFILDGKKSDFSDEDRKRRNTIVQLIEDWGLVEVINRDLMREKLPLNKIKIISFKDKKDWILEAKYSIGNGSRYV